MKKLLFAGVSVVILGLSGVASASTVGVTSLGALGATGVIDWGQLGVPYTVLGSPVNVTSTDGTMAAVTSAGNTFQIRNDPNGGWYGNIGNGVSTNVLWTSQVGPDITFNFSAPVYGLGAQIQADYFGGFTAQVQAWDASSNLLATFTENGNSETPGNDPAIFIGLLSSVPDITTLSFTLTSAASAPNDFAIGPASTVSSVPLPAALPMFGAALFGAAAWARRRKSA